MHSTIIIIITLTNINGQQNGHDRHTRARHSLGLAYAHAPRHDCCLGVNDGRTDAAPRTHTHTCAN